MKRFTSQTLNTLITDKKNRAVSMKMFFMAMMLCSISYRGFATATVTPASGGTGICPGLAVGGGAPAFTPLGDITVTEGATTDFSTGTDVLTITAPAGWQFNTSILPTLTSSGGDITGVALAGGGFSSSTTFSINISTSGTTSLDQFTISGLQIQATSTGAANGNLYATLAGGLAGVISGAVGGTNFGSLSLLTGFEPAVTITASPSTAVCSGSGITFTPNPTNGGSTPTYEWFVNGIFITTGNVFSISTLNNGDRVNAVMTSSLPCSSLTGAVSNTLVANIVPLPGTFTVNGGGSFCAGGTGVTIGLSGSQTGVNYQLSLGGVAVGSVVAGTGGAINFDPQTAPGVYTVIASSTLATGCTVNMTGSATISVIAAPTSFTVTGGGAYCLGGSGVDVTLNGSTPGVIYQLFVDHAVVGSTVGGTGSAIDFGNQTITGNYTVEATDGSTGCTAFMAGNAVVSTTALPASFSITGGGTYCTGGTGVDITLSGSETGVNYQLFTGGAAVSPALTGTGSTIDFGNVTAAGTYTVIGTNAATTCSATVGTTIVTAANLPTTYTVLGGGTYCSGGAGLDVSITGSDNGTNYQLFRAGVNTGIVVAGTGNPLDLGLQMSAGDYTVVAVDATTGCTSNMTGDAMITVSALPTAFGLIGGGATCAGGPGINVSQVGSESGVNYQLYVNGVQVGAPQSGSGTFLSYGAEATAGTYTAIGTNVLSGCSSQMNDSVVVTLIPAPNAYTVTGGNIGYCVGGNGVDVGLSGSDLGVNYQLFADGSAVGGLVPGTSGPLDFGLQTTAANYTIIGTNTTTFCDATMTGSSLVTVNNPPTAFAISGGGNYCAGGNGVDITLTGSTTGVNYQLYNGTTAVGTPVAGTGSALDFGLQTGVGTYSIIATNATTTCVANQTGTVAVDTLSLPNIYSVTGGGSYCTGGTGVDVQLNGSDATGVSYQLYNLSTPVGLVTAGTGAAIDFGNQIASGNYTVKATNTNGCTSTMNSSVAVVVLPLPTVFNVEGGGSYCTGGTGVDVSLNSSAAGVNYQLYNGTTPAGAAVAGTGAAIDFGLQTAAGTYTVVATDATFGCTANMADSAVVAISSLPTAYTVSGTGTICDGSGQAVDVTLSGSDAGLTYQLYNGTTPVGSPVAGTGAALDFGFQTTGGTYTVVATNASSTCTGNMTGSGIITANPAPTAYPVIGGGAYCVGGTGLHIGLSSSDLGISYQLYLNGIPTGTTLSGIGGAIDYGAQTTAGNYTIVGTNPTTGCSGNMVGRQTIAISPLPTAYDVTGGGAYCFGGAGSDVQLSSSDFGVNYQLYLDGTATGAPVAGTGLMLDFGLQTGLGNYTVVGTNASAGCTTNMNNFATVTSALPPNTYTVTGGGSSCVAGVGFNISLLGSDAGVSYQVYNGSAPSGPAVIGTGGALDLGTQTAAGIYSVIATDPATGCTTTMAGSASISVVGYPTVAILFGAPSVCQFGTATYTDATAGGVFSSSNTSIADVSGGLVTGVGAGTATISYTVTNGAGCATTVTQDITVLPAPTVPAITGTPNACLGATGVSLADATSGGVWSSGNTFVATVDASGNINIASQGTTVISYVVTDPGGCSGSASVLFTVGDPIPTSAILPLHTATICHGIPVDLNVVITGGITGYTFQWFDSGIALPGAVLDTYETFTPGLYTVAVSNGTCTSVLTDTTNVYAPPAPVISYDTTAGLLFTAPSFVNYQWFRNDTLLTNDTTNHIPYGTPGSYTVLVSDMNLCYDTSAPFVEMVDTSHTGVISYATGSNVKIYPNPASAILHIDADQKVFITISTLDGKVMVDRKEAVTINVGNLADGMYMIMVYDANNNLLKTDKFVKMQ